MDYEPSNKSKSEIQSRIRESEDSCQVKAHSKPWIVRIIVADSSMCGGTLIGKKTVVTAAHCVSPRFTNVTKVIIGDHHRTDTDCEGIENEQCRNVTFIDVHKDWTGNVFCSFSIEIYFT